MQMARRVPRFLFTTLSAVSLLVWIGIMALWVRSHWASDVVTIRTPVATCDVVTFVGEVSLQAEPPTRTSRRWLLARELPGWPEDLDDGRAPLYAGGFYCGRTFPGGRPFVILPYWYMAVAALILPSLWALFRPDSRR